MISPTRQLNTKLPRCLLLADDPVHSGPVVDAAAARGLALDTCANPADIVPALASAEYGVVGVRLDLAVDDPGPEAALAELVRGIRAAAPNALVVGLGVSGTTTERTAAGRLGVDLYLGGGARPEMVLDTWERLLRSRFHAVLLDVDDEYVKPLEAAVDGLNCDLTALDDTVSLFEDLGRLSPNLLVLRKRPVGFNAIELLRALRVSEAFAGLPVLLIVDRPDSEFELCAYAAGADGVLADPTPGELRARLRTLMSRTPGGAPAAETRSEPVTAGAMQSDGDIPSVIVVEDDPSLLEMLEYSLGNKGHRIDLHTDGRAALTALLELDTRGRRPVVLLDVDLPGLDGFGVLREISRVRPGQFQVIITTVHSSEAAQVLALQTGAIDYIVKPVRMPVVLAKVQRLLESAGMA